jgi:hypothetical protein
MFPAGYHNLMHRSVLGLGIWQRMTGRQAPRTSSPFLCVFILKGHKGEMTS